MNTPIMKRLFAGTALLAMLIGAPLAQAADKSAATGNAADTARIEGIIEQYLMDHPDVLLRAIQNVQIWQTAEHARKQSEAIDPVWDSMISDASMPSTGPADAPVTVIEFFDYHCGYCKSAFNGVMDLAENSDNKIRTIFVEFPILRPESAVASRAALAAAKQGKYMELHRVFMEERGVISKERIDDLAASIGINVDQLHKDMQAPEINGMLQRNAAMAEAIGVNGTPAFLINRHMVPGADMERVNALVAAGLENAS